MDQQPAQALTSTLRVPTRCDIADQSFFLKANDAAKIVAATAPNGICSAVTSK